MRQDINAKLVGYRDQNIQRAVFIQIDGVPYDIMKKGLEKGYMPHIKRVLKFGNYKMYKYYSELPSNTPAAQMKLMYGVKGIIKAFRWYNKQEKRHYTFKDSTTAKYWEEEGEKASTGKLLDKGASYINMFSGGAKRNILIFSRMFDTDIKTRVVNSKIWKFIFLNADFIVKVLTEVAEEFFVEMYEHFKYKMRNMPQRAMNLFPYVRVCNNVFLKEIATMGAVLEMNEMVDRIYLTYTGYDEVGHQRGPETKEALKTLKKIDRSVGKIIKMAKKKGYELYIFSDHGQSSTTPFKDIYGKRLADFIMEKAGIIEERLESAEGENSDFVMIYSLKKLFNLFIFLEKKIMARIVKKIFKKSVNSIKKDKIDIEERIITECSGPLAHIYFNEEDERMEYSRINSMYQGIFDLITMHEGVEFGVGVCGEGYIIRGRHGEIVTDKNFKIKEEKGVPFKNIIGMGKEKIMESLGEICTGKDSGDIVLFGAVIAKNRVVNFEEQYGGHGGLGGMQNFPFIISKHEYGEDISIMDLYSSFTERFST